MHGVEREYGDPLGGVGVSVVDAPGAVIDRHRHRPAVAVVTARPWLAALVTTKLADVLTTVVGLALLPQLVERAPLAAYAIRSVGPLVGFGGLSLVVLALTVGLAESIPRCFDCRAGRWGRLAAYALVTVLWSIATANNLILIFGRLP